MKHPVGASESGSVEDEGADGDPDLPLFPWMAPKHRLRLPVVLRDMLGAKTAELAVPSNIVAKIADEHAYDLPFLDRLGELLDRWELAGFSPKHAERLEIYARLDDIWFTVVITHDQRIAMSVLLTMHRIRDRKVRSRERQGYLRRRGEEG